jgi:thioredoxin-related protein
MKKQILFILIFQFVSVFSFAQNVHGLVKWITFEQAEKKAKENPKPILIDVYTDWCGWCKRMMITTYSDPQVANYINENFYPVAFNAETRDTIRWQNEVFVNTEKTHQLARKFQSTSYPTTIFMDGDFQNSTKVPGYLESNTIAPILVYFKEQLHPPK